MQRRLSRQSASVRHEAPLREHPAWMRLRRTGCSLRNSSDCSTLPSSGRRGPGLELVAGRVPCRSPRHPFSSSTTAGPSLKPPYSLHSTKFALFSSAQLAALTMGAWDHADWSLRLSKSLHRSAHSVSPRRLQRLLSIISALRFVDRLAPMCCTRHSM